MSGSRTAQNMLVVSGALCLQIVIQFLFQRLLAATYGASGVNDALFAALAVPTLLAAIVTGSLAYVLVPHLAAGFSDLKDEPETWGLAVFIGYLTAGISSLCAVGIYLAAWPICRALYGEMAPEPLERTVELLRVLSVQVLLTGLISWAGAVHHSRHQFVVPACGGMLGVGVTLILAHIYGATSIAAIAWAINAGSLTSVFIHVGPLARWMGRPQANWVRLAGILRMIWPLLLGAAFMRIDPLVDRVLAARLDPGSLSHINFAQRIVVALIAIGTTGLSVIAFPQLAQRLTDEGRRGFEEHFSLACRRLILLAVPICIGASMFAIPIVRDLLQEGAFTPQDASTVGLLIVGFMGMFLGASAGELLSRGFYVLGDSKTPTVIGVVALCVGLVLKFTLFETFGIWGIAAAVSVYYVLSAATLAVVLASKASWRIYSGCQLYLVQSITAALAACGVCALFLTLLVASTLLAAPLGALVYYVSLQLMRNPDAGQLQHEVLVRFGGKGLT